ncbi:hypothetical protein SCUP515_01000 [Seiridium cupressi]
MRSLWMLTLYRSILQHLEQLAADLACSEATASQGNDGSFEGTRQGARIDDQVTSSHDHVLKIGAFSFGNRMTSSLLGMHTKFQYQAKLFYPSERPPYKIPVRGIYYDIQPRTAGRAYAARFSDFNAKKVPVQVAIRLFQNYRDSILPRFPCFSEEELTDHFNYMYGEGPPEHPPSELSHFIMPIILAISSLTSSSHDFAKVAALTLILPYTANLWYLTGEAMRIAVSLGLHHELDPACISEETGAELRKRLFWVIYQVDRIVGVSGACPLALSDRYITVKLPYGGGNPFCPKPARSSVSRSNSYRENLFLIHTKMRIVQSEIHGVQFFDQPLPNGMLDYDEWVQKTQELIQKLIDQVTVDGIAPSWLVFAGHQCQVLLFRPCSRRIVVSNDSMLAAVRACIQLIKSDMVSLERGGFAMTFEVVNSAFHAGMVLLYALRSHATGLEQASLAATARETLEVLVRLLKMHGTRWPAILDTSHYIKDSMDTCLRDTSGRAGSAYDMSIVEELDYLVTQRRVHSVFHRNIPFIPPHHPGPHSDTPSQTSEDFVNDENCLDQAIKGSSHTSHSVIHIEDGFPSASVTNELFDLYARSAHLFFPVLETKMLNHLASTCDGSCEEAQKNSHEFCYLILAIASLIGKRNEPLLAVQAYAWFQKAELMKEETGSLEEHISICSYLISFKKLHIYESVLSSDRDSEHISSTQSRTAFEYQDHQNSLDRWLARWEELVASNLDHENRHQLQCWGQFHYYHGTFLVSLPGAAYAGKYSPPCQHMTDAALKLARYNQLFARRMVVQPEYRSPILFPMDWTNSHFILQVGYSAFADTIAANADKDRSISSFQRYLSLLTLLEADPETLLTGHSLVFKEFYEG